MNMFATHRVFLLWLLYLVIIVFGIAVLAYLGLPQLALYHDRSHLTILLLALYGLAEVLAGRQAWIISTENRKADDVIAWLAQHKISSVTAHHDGIILSNAPADSVCIIAPSAIADHLTLLQAKLNAGQHHINQGTIIDVTADRLYSRALIGDFISGRIVWIGILATILGVIMAFWPMIDGVSIDAMKANLGEFFSGIAVAFLPTAISFVCKIVLDFNSRIIAGGVRDLIDKIACISETTVLPFLDADPIE